MDKLRAAYVRSVMDRMLKNISPYDLFVYRVSMPTIRRILGIHLIPPLVGLVEEYLWCGNLPANIDHAEVLQYLHSNAYRMVI